MVLNSSSETDGNFTNEESTGFSIKASAKAFKILSDSLYTNKILAVVRELSCNAYDAHVAVGTPEKSFTVHLPKSERSERFFSVRDYGPGLSEEDVLSLYSTYFDSTKTGSNDYVGALGLGSKSPFSYTDSFTVNSYFGGFKKSYLAFISEEGFPRIQKVSEEPSDEQGLEVIVQVRDSSDAYSFVSEAKEVFNYFPVKPILNQDINFQERETIELGSSWAIHKYRSDANKIICGVVAYDLNNAATLSILEGEESLKFFSSLLNRHSFHLKVGLGVVDVAASRETLSLDDRTRRNLKVLLVKMYEELKDKYIAETSGFTPFEKSVYGKLKSLKASSSIFSLFFDMKLSAYHEFKTSYFVAATKNRNPVALRAFSVKNADGHLTSISATEISNFASSLKVVVFTDIKKVVDFFAKQRSKINLDFSVNRSWYNVVGNSIGIFLISKEDFNTLFPTFVEIGTSFDSWVSQVESTWTSNPVTPRGYVSHGVHPFSKIVAKVTNSSELTNFSKVESIASSEAYTELSKLILAKKAFNYALINGKDFKSSAGSGSIFAFTLELSQLLSSETIFFIRDDTAIAKKIQDMTFAVDIVPKVFELKRLVLISKVDDIALRFTVDRFSPIYIPNFSKKEISFAKTFFSGTVLGELFEKYETFRSARDARISISSSEISLVLDLDEFKLAKAKYDAYFKILEKDDRFDGYPMLRSMRDGLYYSLYSDIRSDTHPFCEDVLRYLKAQEQYLVKEEDDEQQVEISA
jgi:hypothetical protein